MFGKQCIHKWKIIVDRVLPSAFEQTKGQVQHIKGNTEMFFKKKSITILQCDLYGKLDKTIVENP